METIKPLTEQVNEALNQQQERCIKPKFQIEWDAFVSFWVAELKKNETQHATDTTGIQQINKIWLNGGKRSLYLCGGVGNGKTTIAKALLSTHNRFDGIDTGNKYILEKAQDFVNAQFVTARQIIGMAQQAMETKASEALRKLQTTMFLIIDDLGVEQTEINNYGTVETPVIEILEKRYESRLPTIITSNLTLEQIKKKYGVRVYDRIVEQYEYIGFNQESYRK